MSNDGTVQLNNYLQTQKKLTSLSWEESFSGPENAPTHKVICKIDGTSFGVGTGSQKNIAKDIAAKEALKALTGEPE